MDNHAFVRKSPPQDQFDKYDQYIREIFALCRENLSEAEKINKSKQSYLKIAPNGIDVNADFFNKLFQLKQDVEKHNIKYADYFKSATHTLLQAEVIDKNQYLQLTDIDKKALEKQRKKELQEQLVVDELRESINLNTLSESDKRASFYWRIIENELDTVQSKSLKQFYCEKVLENIEKIDWKKLKPDLQVEATLYGSYIQQTSFKDSDIDFSLQTVPIIEERTLLRYFYEEIKKLLGQKSIKYKGLLEDKIRIPKQDIIFQDNQQEVEIGFTVRNQLGIENSKLLQIYSSFDPRVKILNILIKKWAKVQKIHGAHNHYYSSYAYQLFIISYLQVEEKILPSLQKISKEKKEERMKEIIRDYQKENEVRFTVNVAFEQDEEYLKKLKQHYYNNNNKNIDELLLGFFKFMKKLINQEAEISIKDATVRYQKSNQLLISIEDPFDIKHNPGQYISRNDENRAEEIKQRISDAIKLVENGKFEQLFQASKNQKK